MKCVICKTGDVKKTSVQAEIKVGYDHLMVTVQAEACTQCGEPYYTTDAMRYLERLRETPWQTNARGIHAEGDCSTFGGQSVRDLVNPLTLIPSLILASRSKPIMVLNADAWFHDFRRTAIRNSERRGIPRSVAKLMHGPKRDSVYERYNVASKRDLDVAREKMERNAMEQLYSTFNSTSNSHPPARHGHS